MEGTIQSEMKIKDVLRSLWVTFSLVYPDPYEPNYFAFLFSGKPCRDFRGTRENEHKLKEFAAFNKLYPPTNGSYNKDRNITLFLYLVCIFLLISSSLSLSLPRLMFFGDVNLPFFQLGTEKRLEKLF